MQIISFKSKIFILSEIEHQLINVLEEMHAGKCFVLTDPNTHEHCLPYIDSLLKKERVQVWTIKQGESEKGIDTVVSIWNFLQQQGADRESVVINLGGGMLLDTAGFAASTFKRGIRFINIPTTLLSMVDASVGGKTGINFNDFKNHIGTFAQPEYVLISPKFLRTLDERQIYSGWAEMLKHGLIRSVSHLEKLLALKPGQADGETLNILIYESVEIKNAIIQRDPYEQGFRKVLNFGHTIGHAFESIAFSGTQSLLHGESVANGLIVELYLSSISYNPNKVLVDKVINYIREHYEPFQFSDKDLDQVYEYLIQDKKNTGNRINFTLLRDIGDPLIDKYLSRNTIESALAYYIRGTMKS
jgi:3-dehydroquinate synthase